MNDTNISLVGMIINRVEEHPDTKVGELFLPTNKKVTYFLDSPQLMYQPFRHLTSPNQNVQKAFPIIICSSCYRLNRLH